MTSELFAFLILMALVWLVMDTMRQHDAAVVEATRLCSEQGVQLLDQTVGLNALKLKRIDGRYRLLRYYTFEVSPTGNERLPGTLWLVNGRAIGAFGSWLNTHGQQKVGNDSP